MMKFRNLFSVKDDCENYSITLNKNFINEIKNSCNKNLILSLVEFFLTLLMEIELIEIIGLNRGEHSKERKIRRNGYQTKKWSTLIGEIELAVPRTSKGGYTPFFVQALNELTGALKSFCVFSYVCGVTTRYIGKLMENIGLKPVDKSAVSRYSKKFTQKVEKAFDKRDLSGMDCPVIMVDALYEKVRVAFAYCKVAVIVVTGIDLNGTRHFLDVQVCFSESTRTYRKIFKALMEKGLSAPELVVSDGNRGIRKAVLQSFPGCVWQSCSVHLIRQTLHKVKKKNKLDFLNSLRQVYQAENHRDSLQAVHILEQSWKATEGRAVNYFLGRVEDTLAFHQFPEISYRKIYTTNLHERFNRSIRKRTRCSNQFPSVESYRRLVLSFFEYYGDTWREDSCFSREEMASIKREGELRREKVDSLLGEESFGLDPDSSKAGAVLIVSTGVEIRNEEVYQTALVLAAVGSYEGSECKVLDFTLIDGFNDQQKYEGFFDRVQSHLNDDSLVVAECGQPVLERVLPEYFSSSQLKYGCESLLEEFVSLTPTFLRKSILAFSDDLFRSNNCGDALDIAGSLKTLWNGQLAEASNLLYESLPAIFDNDGQNIQLASKSCFNKAEKFLKSVTILIENQKDLTSVKKDLAGSLTRYNQKKYSRRKR